MVLTISNETPKCNFVILSEILNRSFRNPIGAQSGINRGGADKSLARPGRKQAIVSFRMA